MHDDLVTVLGERSAGARQRLRYDGRHERAEIEAEVEVERAAVAERFRRGGAFCDRLEPAADHETVGIVGQRLGKSQDYLVLIGQVVDGDAAWSDGHVGLRSGGTEAVAGSPATHDRDVAECGRIDGDSGAEPDRDLLGSLVQRGRALAADEERRRAGGIRRDKIKRHDAAFFEPLHVAIRGAVVTLLLGVPSRPPVEDFAYCRLPGCLGHKNRLEERWRRGANRNRSQKPSKWKTARRCQGSSTRQFFPMFSGHASVGCRSPRNKLRGIGSHTPPYTQQK